MKEEDLHDPFFLPLTEFVAKPRDRRFLYIVGKMLKLDWLNYRTLEDVTTILSLLLPSFACQCVENNDLVCLQEILDMMDVDAEDYDGNTVMHRACEKGITYIVKHLLSIGASCHRVNRSGCTPLHLAIKNKHIDVIKILNREGATITLKPVQVGIELIKAVWLKDCKLLHAWYLAGADMNQDDYNGQTALHVAVEKRDKHMVSKLLEYGGSPEV
ncbi:L-asparaginase [Danio aesculapii]|uniref:L-asparaginase n=1 Tax=Danio aesculapii TaxID=1142201 RepID=UPI0024C0C022|nr:L-asparaginase [Danio aesculapii]